jgi:lipopolysaccharide/colanic/teichoic acid biosynthesis glycosyltransferase
MSIQAILSDTSPYRRVAGYESEVELEPIRDSTFLYIGTTDRLAFTNHFTSGRIAGSFAKAEELLSSMSADKLPDVLFIDIPLQAAALKQFCQFLQERQLLCFTPIIYNLAQLTKSRMEYARQMKLIEKAGCVDDIIDFSAHDINYASKVEFLKEAKRNLATANSCFKKNRLRLDRRSFFLFLKRGLDIILSFLAIILLLPVFIIIAIAIKIESRGPVFYNAVRAGRRFKVFKFYKFRSMVANADKTIEALSHLNQYDTNESGPRFFKIVNDPRVTRLGKFLRNSSLDELPQLFNVLKGDMSIVGNRPLPLYEAETLTTNKFIERFNAPAGITGLWQIKKRGKKEMSVEERINLDITYARNISLLVDLGIMAKTPIALLQKTNV